MSDSISRSDIEKHVALVLDQKRKARRAELVRKSMIRILPHFLQVANTEDSVQGAMTAAIRAADAFLKWRAGK